MVCFGSGLAVMLNMTGLSSHNKTVNLKQKPLFLHGYLCSTASVPSLKSLECFAQVS